MNEASEHRSRPARWKLLLCFAVLFCIYTANGRESGAGDTLPTVLLPVAILRGDGPYLDRFASLWPHGLPYFIAQSRGHLVSRYPIGVALLAVPLIAPQLAVLDALHPEWEHTAPRIYARQMAKLAAAGLAALTGMALFVLLCGLTSERFGMLAAAIAALGSDLWAVAAQSLWQHGPAALALTLAILLLAKPGATRARLVLAGLASAALVVFRPQNIVFSLAIFAWVALRYRAKLVWFLPFPLLLGAGLVASNYWFFGTLGGGYAEMLSALPETHGVVGYWTTDVARSASGTLFSPSRGLFVFCPWIPVALATLPAHRFRLQRDSLIAALLLALLVFLLQLSLQAVWWAGHSFGPRYWTDVTPLFAIVLVWALEWSWRRSRPLFGLLLLTGLAAVGIQAIGAFCYPSSWGKEPVDIDVAHARLWDWRDSDLTRCLRECQNEKWPPSPGTAPALQPPGL